MLGGTPEYIAPKVLLRKSYISSVDTWIFGLIEYVLLGRSLSFDDENHVRLYRKIPKGRDSYTGKVRAQCLPIDLVLNRSSF